MIMYYGTTKSLSSIPYGTTLTSCLKEACARAKLKCDEMGVAVSDAWVYAIDVPAHEHYRLKYLANGVKHIDSRHNQIKKSMDYGELRRKGTQEEWNLLHAPHDWLTRFIKHYG